LDFDRNLVRFVFGVVGNVICGSLGETSMVCNGRRRESSCRFVIFVCILDRWFWTSFGKFFL